jgi:anti-sigma factor RsiW
MTCREFADFIIDYSSGDLADGIRAAFEEHLRLCPNCRAYLALYLTTVGLGRRFAESEQADAAACGVPEDLVTAILDARPR